MYVRVYVRERLSAFQFVSINVAERLQTCSERPQVCTAKLECIFHSDKQMYIQKSLSFFKSERSKKE